jgi:choice-of-anchor A domain-containing protein
MMKPAGLVCMASLLGVALIFAVPAHADPFNLPSFTVFGTQSVIINDSLDENTICITGNVGTGGDLLLDKCRVNGSIFVGTGSDLSLGSHGAFSGSLITGSLSGVGATISAVSSGLNGLSANQTISGNLTSNMTFHNTSTTGGTDVIDITGNVALNGNTLTFVAANASDKFVVNVGGNFDFAQSIISMSGFTNADQLIFNITHSCSSVAEINKGTTVWSGILLAPECDIRVHNQLAFAGELFGANVTIDSAAKLSQPPSTVPEPGTLALLGTGLLGFAGAIRRKLAA